MAGAADPNQLQGYSTPCNIMLSNKKRGAGAGVGLGSSYCSVGGWALICFWEVASGEKHHLGVFLLLFSFLFSSLIKLSLSGSMRFLDFPVLSRVSRHWGARGCKVLSCCPGVSTHTTEFLNA